MTIDLYSHALPEEEEEEKDENDEDEEHWPEVKTILKACHAVSPGDLCCPGGFKPPRT
jgi:hypothetical protein